MATSRPCPSNAPANRRSSLWNATASTSAISSVRRSANSENTYWRNGAWVASNSSNTGFGRTTSRASCSYRRPWPDNRDRRPGNRQSGRSSRRPRRDKAAARGLRCSWRRGSSPPAPMETDGKASPRRTSACRPGLAAVCARSSTASSASSPRLRGRDKASEVRAPRCGSLAMSRPSGAAWGVRMISWRTMHAIAIHRRRRNARRRRPDP